MHQNKYAHTIIIYITEEKNEAAGNNKVPGCLSPTFQTEDLVLDALVSQTLPLIANRGNQLETKSPQKPSTSTRC